MSAPADTLPVLWQMRFSHYNEKARWALDHKQIPHRRHSLVPGAHRFRAKQKWGGDTTPMIEIDGRFTGDSAAIVAELERRWPERPLYPSDPQERERALGLEKHFGTEVGPYVRGAAFDAALPYRDEALKATVGSFGAFARTASRVMYPVTRRVLQKQLVDDIGGGEHCRRKTVEGLDRIEAELGGREFLVGESLTVADITAAALLSPLVAPPEFAYPLPDPWPPEWEELRGSLSGHPGYRWVAETFRRHRGASAEVGDG
jgi:glutathione S-transferase